MYSYFLRYTLWVPDYHSCVVSFRDWDRMEHSVEVSAASLYEAAALALKEFRTRREFAEHIGPGSSTTLRVRVKPPEMVHEVQVEQVECWLNSVGKPKEMVIKTRLREMLSE